MVPILSFVGHHSSGKTSFLTKVIKLLKIKGYKVATIKSTIHENVVEDKKGKDTYKFKEAGSDSVGIITPSQVIFFKERDDLKVEHLIFSLFYDYDIVLCEGFKKSELPKLEVFRKEAGAEPLFKELRNVMGIVTSTEIEGIANFSIENPEEVVEFIEKFFIQKRFKNDTDIELFVNSKPIPLKGYVKATLQGIVYGFVNNLKGIEYLIKSLDIKIKAK